jgi:hypothetical protein
LAIIVIVDFEVPIISVKEFLSATMIGHDAIPTISPNVECVGNFTSAQMAVIRAAVIVPTIEVEIPAMTRRYRRNYQ